MPHRPVFIAALAPLALAPTLFAQTSYDEFIDGELSNDRLAPTALSFAEGANDISGTFGFDASANGGDGEQDVDYFTFTIAEGFELSEIVVIRFAGDDDVAFMGIQQGTQLTEPAIGADAGNLLGYVLFGPGSATATPGTDILDDMGMGPGSMGFSGPLGAGDYTIWLNQTGPTTTHTTRFVVTAIPTPASAALLGLGGLVATRRRR